jgi:hypothetical protein
MVDYMTYLKKTYATDPNDVTRSQEFDNLFSSAYTLDVAHHEVHEGDMYAGVVSDNTAASTDVIQEFVLTPAVATPQKRIHMVVEYAGSGAHSYTINEGCTYSSGGAAATPLNRNRGAGKTSALQSMYVGGDNLAGGVIVVTGGSTIWTKAFGSGRNVGGAARDVEEWVLAPATGYLFTLTSGATSTAIAMEAIWYEHTDE